MFAIDLTENAQLRPLEPWQAEEFLAHMNRARATVDPWIPWASVSTDLASATATLQRYAENAAKDKQRLYGVWLDGTLVGGTMFVAFDAKSGNCEVGVWLEPSATGRGLITRAARVLIDWAFRVRGMHRVEWHCNPDNVDSSNVARRLGMTCEARLRESYPWQGVRNDTEIWAVLASEWK